MEGPSGCHHRTLTGIVNRQLIPIPGHRPRGNTSEAIAASASVEPGEILHQPLTTLASSQEMSDLADRLNQLSLDFLDSESEESTSSSNEAVPVDRRDDAIREAEGETSSDRSSGSATYVNTPSHHSEEDSGSENDDENNERNGSGVPLSNLDRINVRMPDDDSNDSGESDYDSDDSDDDSDYTDDGDESEESDEREESDNSEDAREWDRIQREARERERHERERQEFERYERDRLEWERTRYDADLYEIFYQDIARLFYDLNDGSNDEREWNQIQRERRERDTERYERERDTYEQERERDGGTIEFDRYERDRYEWERQRYNAHMYEMFYNDVARLFLICRWL